MPAFVRSSCTWPEHRCNDTIHPRQSVRGGLVPQEPDDEPASVLLGLIRGGRVVRLSKLDAPATP